VLLLGVVAAIVARRLSVPVLILFLGLGMLLGSEGLGGIYFDDAELARTIGVIGLIAILFEGGLSSDWRDIRPVLLPAFLLSTAGVLATSMIVGAGAYYLFDLSWPGAFLLGAVVGSTDAAAVFATLRFTTLRRRTASLLGAESGANDPMAVALTLGLIAWLTQRSYGVGDLTLLLVRQLGVGLEEDRAALACERRESRGDVAQAAVLALQAVSFIPGPGDVVIGHRIDR